MTKPDNVKGKRKEVQPNLTPKQIRVAAFWGTLLSPFTYIALPLIKMIVRWQDPEGTRRSERFHSIEAEIRSAYGRAEFDNVVLLCHEYLELAEQCQDDFNWGNAVHNGKQYLGLVAMRRDQIGEAKKYLLAAGNSVGLPQLNSYGPLMRLAYELLLKGERDVVIQHLNFVSKWWGTGPASPPEVRRATMNQINKWKRQIRRGHIPTETQWVG